MSDTNVRRTDVLCFGACCCLVAACFPQFVCWRRKKSARVCAGTKSAPGALQAAGASFGWAPSRLVGASGGVCSLQCVCVCVVRLCLWPAQRLPSHDLLRTYLLLPVALLAGTWIRLLEVRLYVRVYVCAWAARSPCVRPPSLPQPLHQLALHFHAFWAASHRKVLSTARIHHSCLSGMCACVCRQTG